MMTDDQKQEFSSEMDMQEQKNIDRNGSNSEESPTRRKRVRIASTSRPTTKQSGSERINYNQGRQPRTSHSLRPEIEDPFHEGSATFGQRPQRPYSPQNNQRPTKPYADSPQRPYAPQRDYNKQGGAQRPAYPQNRADNNLPNDDRPVYPHSPMSRQLGHRTPERYESPGAREGGAYPPYGSTRPYNQQCPSSQQQAMRPKRKQNAPRKTQPQVVKYQEVLADPNEPIRLNKFLANAGVCSRREADELIRNGEVTVNGEVVTELGTRITRQDVVVSRGTPVSIESKVYVLLNKPKNCVTTSDDPQCRRTVMDIVANACSERIYPVGRLDRNTTGVMLITNDGDLASKLTHPSFMKKKIYHVWLDKPVSIEDMQSIAEGIELEDGEIHADAISYVREDDLSEVGIEIHSGRNRLVRRIFEHLGYRVQKLDRVYFAGLTKKNLGRGRWRYLNEQEVNNLRMGHFE